MELVVLKSYLGFGLHKCIIPAVLHCQSNFMPFKSHTHTQKLIQLKIQLLFSFILCGLSPPSYIVSVY